MVECADDLWDSFKINEWKVRPFIEKSPNEIYEHTSKSWFPIFIYHESYDNYRSDYIGLFTNDKEYIFFYVCDCSCDNLRPDYLENINNNEDVQKNEDVFGYTQKNEFLSKITKKELIRKINNEYDLFSLIDRKFTKKDKDYYQNFVFHKVLKKYQERNYNSKEMKRLHFAKSYDYPSVENVCSLTLYNYLNK